MNEKVHEFVLVGFRVTDATNNGFTVSVAAIEPLNVAVITGLATVDTTRDVTENVAVVDPTATTNGTNHFSNI